MKVSAKTSRAPRISVVIPVYNEAAILRAATVSLWESLSRHGLDFELLLSENGSQDGSRELARELSANYPGVRWLSTAEPNYGAALRAGIRDARGEIVICEEIDLCHVAFHLEALTLLDSGADLVIGSKLISGARDQRPLIRHAASVVYTKTLQLLFGLPGTDTHGLKAFRRARLLPIVEACVVDRDVFASELVIRSYRAGLDVREIPTCIAERRRPSIHLLRRLPNVAKNLAKLTWAIRLRG